MWHTTHINKRKIWKKSCFSPFCCVPVVQQSWYVEKTSKLSHTTFFIIIMYLHIHGTLQNTNLCFFQSTLYFRLYKYWRKPHFFGNSRCGKATNSAPGIQKNQWVQRKWLLSKTWPNVIILIEYNKIICLTLSIFTH